MSKDKQPDQLEPQYVTIDLSTGMQIWGELVGCIPEDESTNKRYAILKPIVAMFSVNQQGNYKFDFFPYMICKKNDIVEINLNHIVSLTHLDDSCIKGEGKSFVDEYKECVRRFYDGSKLEIPAAEDKRILLNE